jgi:uncharacterized protein
MANSFLSPKLELRPCPAKGGWGVFAAETIKKDELLTVWGGRIMTEEESERLPSEIQRHGLQVEERIYLIPLTEGEDADYFNHSCNPNAGLNGQICLVAMREINIGEEVCFDYAMSDSSDYDEFECRCGSANCRKKITGNDWKLTELHKKYEGYFIPYLQKRINSLYQE